jgi:peptide deformylase
MRVKTYGCEVLRKIAEPVSEMTPEIESFIEDLVHTMYETEGVGIAAPQVGLSKRIFACDPQYSETGVKKPIVCINPEFIKYDGERVSEEGCLSIPDVFEKVKRFEKVEMQYRDLKWNLISIEAEDVFATILQHELDHLNGVSFVDKLTPIRKMALGFKLNRIAARSSKMKEGIEIINKDDS